MPFNLSNMIGALFTPLPEGSNMLSFSGEEDPQEHLLKFEGLTCGESYNEFNHMISFAATLIGKACGWYLSLPPSSISSWEGFIETFERGWYHKKDVVQLYQGLLSTEKKDDEFIF